MYTKRVNGQQGTDTYTPELMEPPIPGMEKEKPCVSATGAASGAAVGSGAALGAAIARATGQRRRVAKRISEKLGRRRLRNWQYEMWGRRCLSIWYSRRSHSRRRNLRR